jgi:hypothetical protein
MKGVNQLSVGDLRVWLEQDQSICLKAVTRFGDPVELSTDEAEELITILQRLVVHIKSLD